MPILKHGAVVKKQSAEVLAYLEEAFPASPRLIPSDPALRKRVLDLQTWFDEAGPMVRRAGFFELLLHAA